MLLDIIESASPTILLMVVLSLTVAGLMKGIIGVGMPTVAIPLLSIFIDLKASVMLLSVPLVLSNIPQAMEGGETFKCFVRLVPVLLGMVPGIFLGVTALLTISPLAAKLFVGLVVMIAAALPLLAPQLRLKECLQTPVGVAAGFMGGALGGIAAMSGPMVFCFLLAKGLRGRDFTKEASLYLVLSAALLAVTLSSSSQYSGFDLAISTLALAPVAVGMLFGQRFRDRIPPEAFKATVLVIVLASGAGLMIKSLFS
jgi:uncharacterized membrane protein YfcA